MYEAMKPKDAARVFDRLGLDVLVPVVQQMNPRKMSEVLAAMSPDRAEKLTVALATATRSLMWTYVGAVAFLTLFLTSRFLLRDPAFDTFSALSAIRATSTLSPSPTVRCSCALTPVLRAGGEQ